MILLNTIIFLTGYLRRKIILIHFVLALATTQSVEGQLYSLSFTDTTTFSINCGKLVPSYWGVIDDSCTLTTTPILLPDSCGAYDSIPVQIRVNATGNMECDDNAYFWYLCDSVWYPLDTLNGCDLSAVETFSYNVNCADSSKFAIRVTFENNHNTETYQLRDDDIQIFDPCPILLSISGDLYGESTIAGNLLEWKQPKDNGQIKSIDILRSKDGINYSNISNLIPDNVLTGTYSFLDRVIEYGEYYYQLVINSYSGESFSSSVILIDRVNAMLSANVYSNPSSENVIIDIYTTEAEVLQVTLMDMMGKVCHTSQIVASQAGMFSESLDINSLPSGYYQLNITSPLRSTSQTIFKL